MDRTDESCQAHPYRVRITAGGRIVIPAEVRQDLGVKEGDELLLSVDESGVRLTTYRNALLEARRLVAQYVKPGVSLVDELSRQRAEEVAKEESGPGDGAVKRRRA
ncbi:AbrB/MazE/SpoVT family DNA-binding domain-containing protein [bacterium]|nr:AbrB/MazE/SpoVT family DNA-binding domain-containing protein [bacterium]